MHLHFKIKTAKQNTLNISGSLLETLKKKKKDFERAVDSAMWNSLLQKPVQRFMMS